jgi:hypothetical protein
LSIVGNGSIGSSGSRERPAPEVAPLAPLVAPLGVAPLALAPLVVGPVVVDPLVGGTPLECWVSAPDSVGCA